MAISQTFKPQKAGKAHLKRGAQPAGYAAGFKLFIALFQNGQHAQSLSSEGSVAA